MNSLFRTEAIEAQTDSFTGNIIVQVKPTAWFLCITFFLLFCLLCTYIVWGTYTKHVTVSGTVLPKAGLIKVSSPIEGTISESYVSEGMTIHKGDRLFLITDERKLPDTNDTITSSLHMLLLAQKSSLESQIEKEREINTQEMHELKSRITSILNQLEQLKMELFLYNKRIKIAENNLSKLEKLAEQHYVTAITVDEKTDELIDLKTKATTTKRMINSLSTELESSKSELNISPEKLTQKTSEIKRQINSIEQEEIQSASKGKAEVTSYVDGRLSAILVKKHQFVGNQTLATIIPDGEKLEAQLYLPSKSIGFIKQGQTVLLRYQAFPYQKFGQYKGKITAITKSQISPHELPITIPASGTEDLYRIDVNIEQPFIYAYGNKHNLTAGMQVDAEIQLDKRRIVEWMFEPIFSMKGKLSN